MKLTLFFLLAGISIFSNARETSHQTVSPSAEFIELNLAYEKSLAIQPKNNGFVYLAGIMAKKGDDPMSIGQQLIDEHNTNSDSGCTKQSNIEMFSLLSDTSYQRLKEKSITCSIGSKERCELSQHQKFANSVVKENQWLLKRQRQLLNFSAYKNTLKVNASMPFPQNIALQRLSFIDVWIHRLNYTPSEIKQFFEKDYTLNLLRAANATTLLSKVIAIAQLENNYYWLNELLKSVDKDTAKNIIPDYLTQPIPKSVVSFRTAFTGELQFYMSLLNSYHCNEFFTLSSPIGRNDMQRLANSQAKILNILIDISESENYLKKIEQLNVNDEIVQLAKDTLKMTKEIITKHGGDWQEFESIVFLGKKGGRAIFKEKIYIIRANQLASIQKAVRLLNEIRTQAIEKEKITDFLNQPENYSPVTHKPFIWDKNTQQIIIKREKGYFGIDRHLSL